METHPLTLDDTLWQHAAPPPGYAGHAADECYFQTSGSEGQPKWVVHTRDTLRISARAVNAHLQVTAADHWLLTLPLHHVGGFSILIRALESGSRVTQLTGKWDAHHLAAQKHITLTSLVPAQVYDLVAAQLPAPPALRAVLVGGGALSPDIEAAARRLGWPVLKTYGMTETASQVATQTLSGTEMAILPIWQLHTDSDSILTLRGPALAKGYLIEKSSHWHFQPILAENGLRTRDRVTLTPDGFLHFLGREAGTIKILGELVSLATIQAQIDSLRLHEHLHSSDAAVCDLPDPRRESRLVLAVSDMPPSAAAELLTQLNQQLRPFEQITTAPQHLPAIPRSHLGKIRLEALRHALTHLSVSSPSPSP